MKCECGGDIKVTHEDHKYIESGLPNVILHGVEFRTCSTCGDREMVIPRLAQLLRVLAETVAAKESRLTGPEIRFLRKSLGWSGEYFAGVMDVRPESVSRWERERSPMGSTSERLLRLMAVRMSPVESYPNEKLADIAKGKPKIQRIDLVNKSGWKPQHATSLDAV